jgi:hypothetical protein
MRKTLQWHWTCFLPRWWQPSSQKLPVLSSDMEIPVRFFLHSFFSPQDLLPSLLTTQGLHSPRRGSTPHASRGSPAAPLPTPPLAATTRRLLSPRRPRQPGDSPPHASTGRGSPAAPLPTPAMAAQRLPSPHRP